MRMITRLGGVSLAATLMLALPVVGSAYEVSFLDGRGAEARTLHKGNYDLAIRRIEARLKDRRHNRDILLTNLCTALVMTRDFERAHDVCNQAVESHGSSVGTAYNSRGVLHAMMNDFLSARVDFDEAGKRTNYPPMSVDPVHRTPERSNQIKAMGLAVVNRQEAEKMWTNVQARGPTPEEDEE